VVQTITIKFTPDQSANKISQQKIDELEGEIFKLVLKTEKLEQSLNNFESNSCHYEPRPSEPFFKVTIEKTSIKNNNENVSFYFRALNSKGSTLHQSRKTIIQQPCWRDDVLTLNASESHQIDVCMF
jgi:hypothetical protein